MKYEAESSPESSSSYCSGSAQSIQSGQVLQYSRRILAGNLSLSIPAYSESALSLRPHSLAGPGAPSLRHRMAARGARLYISIALDPPSSSESPPPTVMRRSDSPSSRGLIAYRGQKNLSCLPQMAGSAVMLRSMHCSFPWAARGARSWEVHDMGAMDSVRL